MLFNEQPYDRLHIVKSSMPKLYSAYKQIVFIERKAPEWSRIGLKQNNGGPQIRHAK